ncbi:MAG: DNA-3-methyladenine glycosylase family protein [Peptoniphilaceae bacterium]|jgi:DNA-3-methyladenine glycosylase II
MTTTFLLRTEEEAMRYLQSRDKRLGAVIEQIGPIERRGNADLFASTVRHIISQQISKKAQQTVWKRLEERTGGVSISGVLALPTAELQSMGISFRKADYILAFARMVEEGEVDLESLRKKDDKTVIRELVQVPGIGPWTAQMLLIFSLGRPDVLSYGDFGILRGMRMVYRHKKIDASRFARYQKRYSPYGTTASLYLWAVAGGAIAELDDPAKK